MFKNRKYFGASITLILAFFFSCNKEVSETPRPFTVDFEKQLTTVPQGFPPIPFPLDNQFTVKRWELGKKLFYDPILSIDSSISCASCHKLNLAFSDNKDFSPGVFNRPGVRNASTLANLAYSPYFLREGSISTLEMQIIVPIQEANEFNHNIVDISNQLANDSIYAQLSQEAYFRDLDPFVITRAIGVFERTLISGNSKFDKYYYQKNNVLTSEEKNGMDLFFSERANCSSCHSDFSFTNYAFENNGLYEIYSDIGRMRFTGDSSDLSVFKTPTLRNVELTAPYMHDGSINTLEEVVEHYNLGGKNHINKSQLIRALDLSQKEKDNLVSFLKTLTDYDFISNSNFRQEKR